MVSPAIEVIMEPVGVTVASVTPFPEGSVEVDPDGRIAAVSVEAQQLLGYQSAELVGQPISVLLPENTAVSRAVGVEALTAALRSAVGVGCRRKDGTRFRATATVRASDIAGGPGISVMIHPLVALFDPVWPHQLLDAVIGSADEAIAVADRGGTILVWNPATARMLGDLEAQPLGR